MIFWAGVETYIDAYPALTRVRKLVEPFLNSALLKSGLADLNGKLRYIPIAMPANMLSRYPARSKFSAKKRIYDCSPVLDYGVFVNGTFDAQIEEYLRGIELAAPYLVKLGANEEQIAEFITILAMAKGIGRISSKMH